MPPQMSAGGYVIVRNTSTGEITSVWGSNEANKEMHEAKKPAPVASRKARRHAKYGKH